ncbi:MAG: alcohol dehydrogenase catalytic domain-containing protein [Dehalococcoidia bacterium]
METKAAVLRELNKPLSIETLELDDPKEKEVLVKVVACGVCHSDLHVFNSDWPVFPPPMVLGHEMAGIVEKVGSGVTRLQVGDHVICCWMVSCGTCFQCMTGNPTLCETAMPGIFGGKLLDGTSRLRDKEGNIINHWIFVSGFSQYAVTPEESTVKIPKDVPLEKACLIGCCVPTGYGSVFNIAKMKPRSSVGVWGCGGVGLSTIDAASLLGAYPIIAVDLEGAKEKIALELGATHFIDSTKEDPVPKVQELTAGRGADYVFECIGDPGAQVQAYWAMRPGGILICSGITSMAAATAFPMVFVSMQQRAIVGTLYGSINSQLDIPKLVDLYMAGALKPDKILTRKIKLEDLNEAFDAMEKRQIVGRWVVVME